MARLVSVGNRLELDLEPLLVTSKGSMGGHRCASYLHLLHYVVVGQCHDEKTIVEVWPHAWLCVW